MICLVSGMENEMKGRVKSLGDEKYGGFLSCYLIEEKENRKDIQSNTFYNYNLI